MSKGFVLDCSVAMEICLADERTPASLALLDRAETEDIIVPALWHIELVNGLLQAERRKRITAEDVISALETINDFPIQTDHEAPRARPQILALAKTHKLTAYDATYLELALRKKFPLATRDEDLIEAARKSGVDVL